MRRRRRVGALRRQAIAQVGLCQRAQLAWTRVRHDLVGEESLVAQERLPTSERDWVVRSIQNSKLRQCEPQFVFQ